MSDAGGSGEAGGSGDQDGKESGNGKVTAGHQTVAPGRLIAGRRKVTAALLVAMTVTAMEQLVVSPAMPTIIAQLKGFEIYPWVISAYLLAATVSTPIYGKLADLFGRKRVLLFGLALFSAGSMLSGTAQSMGQLIAMRTIQGLGAGAVSPIVLTLLGDLFTLEERARIQGLFSTVWGLSSIAGPLIGGWLTVNLNWRWVFFVSVPFAVLAFLMLSFYFHEKIEHRKVAPIDWAGAGLLSAGLSALLLVVLDGSSLGMRVSLAVLGLSAFLLVAFVIRERRAADPILPLDLMVRPTIVTSVMGSFLIGGILFGIDTYVPLFIQGVRGGNASQAGQALTPLFLSWAVSVALAAKAVVRWGFRRGAMFGAGLVSLGALTLIVGATFPAWARPIFTLALIVVGMGMGPSSLGFILAVQHAVSWGQRGVATGAVIFFRTIGGAIGVGVLGGALAWELGSILSAAGSTGIDVGAALRPETHYLLGPRDLAMVQSAMGHSLRNVYVQVLLLALGTLGCAAGLPGKVAASSTSPSSPAPVPARKNGDGDRDRSSEPHLASAASKR
ncbi:MAG: MDR family MFS transporter [Isosphaeraceae bacterium]